MRKTFKTCDNKGFHVTFKNGVTLSTQFGWGNYCENYDKPTHVTDVFEKQRKDGCESDDAEIAIIFDGEFITAQWSKNEDGVQGRVSIDQWFDALEWCKNYKPK